ncbi:peptidase A2 domain-containing protein [Trichonephila clavipes]|nr:peptidase A2 domain-containing protein [Trichonephila clavipes]
MESQFVLPGITTEIMKFHHVVSALQPEELGIVGDVLLNPPAQDIGGIAEVLFLQRLPTHVQQILAISNDQLDKQAEMADRIMAVANPTSSVHVIDAEKQDLQTMLVEISSRLSRLETRE